MIIGVPKEIKAKDGRLTILWTDGHLSQYQGRDLRLACRCAACVDEWSHESLIRPEKVPPAMVPTYHSLRATISAVSSAS